MRQNHNMPMICEVEMWAKDAPDLTPGWPLRLVPSRVPRNFTEMLDAVQASEHVAV
jgi:hypothetical protein